jgi:PAS domain S-box-containing protein
MADTIRLKDDRDDSFLVLCEDAEHVLCRAVRLADDGRRNTVLAVMPAAENPTPANVDRLIHEHALRDTLDAAWALQPLELRREGGRIMLLLDDPGGESLERLLAGPMEVGLFLRLAVALSTVLGRLHERGLVHKDIKPANILVRPATGQVWLTGFGIASRLARERQSPEPPEFIAGTLAYMAPEQTGRMNRSIDSRSDLYSLGVTFYRMLTGALPFTASDPMAWVHCHMARRPIPPSERVDVPNAISAIVMKLLAKTAEDRYLSAAGLESDLRRCLAEWHAGRSIADFSLGRHDKPDRLLIPEKLYGREGEVRALLAAFDRVIRGGPPELVLVSGYSGIGKSSVVNELHKVLVPPRGLFASGKFDQYKRDIPYSTLAQAFLSLVRGLLVKSEADLAPWRAALLDALGPNGRLMTELVPELTLIIGEQPPVPDLPPQQANSRFKLVFQRFIGVFARPEHPLALSLDDLQWLDAATLDLVEDLLTRAELRHLLLIGAYRDNEVGTGHPLARKLETIRQAGVQVHEIRLAPLARMDLTQLLEDALRCDPVNAAPLAELLHGKTGGNPFFANQFLASLAEEGLLKFEHHRAGWRWDLHRIHAKGFTDNVVDLMVQKLCRLPRPTQAALQQMACLGNCAEMTELALVQGAPEKQVHADLWEAVRLEMIDRLDGAYKFVHDRVHEAAYGLIPASERAAAHLRIGRLLAATAPPDALEDRIFGIVNHLNRGAALIATQHERERVLAFNVLAGKRAKRSTAYASARNYLAQAAALLSADAWIHRYESTFELYLLLSECEYLAGNFDAADTLFGMILGRASSAVDAARVHSLRIKLYQVAGKYDEGLSVALGALASFRVTFPDDDQDIKAAIHAQFDDIATGLAGRRIADLLDGPVAADSAKRTIIDLLVDAAPCAYIARPSLFPLVTLDAVNRSIRDGNTDQSSFVYGVFSVMLVSMAEDIPSAYQFSELSLQLNERLDNRRLRGTLLHLHGDHVNFWRRHFATGVPILEQAFTSCLEVGDLVYAGFLAFETVWQLIEKGDTLDDVLASSNRFAAFAHQCHNGAVYETIRLEQQFVVSLQGSTKGLRAVDDRPFDEAASLAVIAKASFGCGMVFHQIIKLILAVLQGRFEEAIEAAANAEPLLGAAMAMPIEATYHFCHALALTGLYPTASAAEREQYRRLLEQKQKKLQLWANNCPENYRNRHLLVSAEIARIESRDLDAMRLYEEAIQSAHECGFLHNEALAHECAARFYAARGFRQFADFYLRKARRGYLRWGAGAKVRQLDEMRPDAEAEVPASDPASPIGTPVDHLDLATVIKVSQALSSEMVLDRFIQTLMRTAIEQAGAERGLLVLSRGAEQRVVAGATTADEAVTVHMSDKAVGASMLPQSVLHYVMHTRESVIVDDAMAQSPFAGDPYIQQRQARSLLCLPLQNHGKLIGILYLENNLAPRVFAPARIAVLKLIASEAAISLENTRLYRDLAEREARIRRLVDANIIGIFIWDIRGPIIEANDAFLRMVGYDREDLLRGQVCWTDLTPAEWRDRDQQHLSKLNATGTLQPFEKEYFRKDGSRVPVLMGVAAFEEGGSEGVAFVLDLTERKRSEAEAHESERRYREVQMDLAHANRVATMGQLTASIAHEINQPIAGAVISAHAALRALARHTPDVEAARRSIERVVRDANRAGEVIGRIRDLIKKAPARKESLDVTKAIHEVIALVRGEAVRNGVSVQTRLAPGLPLVEGDRVQLEQVLLNLIVNAIEAMSGVDEGPRELVIQTAQSESAGAVIVELRDSGPGLANPERAFDPFYTTKPAGLGMGLSICRSIVEAHGGRLRATANEPRGAIFQFTVPACSGEGSRHRPAEAER